MTLTPPAVRVAASRARRGGQGGSGGSARPRSVPEHAEAQPEETAAQASVRSRAAHESVIQSAIEFCMFTV